MSTHFCQQGGKTSWQNMKNEQIEKKYFLFSEIQSVEFRFAVQPHFPNVILILLKYL